MAVFVFFVFFLALTGRSCKFQFLQGFFLEIFLYGVLFNFGFLHFQVRTIACVEMGLVNPSFKRHWTMPVEMELTVLQSSPMALVFSPTLLKITAITLSTVISSERGKSKEAVTSTAPPRPALPSLPVRCFPLFHCSFLSSASLVSSSSLWGFFFLQLCPLVASILLAPGTFLSFMSL